MRSSADDCFVPHAEVQEIYAHYVCQAEGAVALCQGLANNTCLQWLNMSWNGLENAGVAAFGDMLKVRAKLLFQNKPQPDRNYAGASGCQSCAIGRNVALEISHLG